MLRLFIHHSIKFNDFLVVHNFKVLCSNAMFCLLGVPCEILSMENDAIKCQTREAPPADKYDLYSGKYDFSVLSSIFYLYMM